MQHDAERSSRATALVLISFVALFWGLSFLSIKVAVATIPPMTLGLSRFLVADLVLLGILLARREKPRLALRDAPLMAGAGLIGVTLYFLFENNGVSLLTASESSLVIGTIPILTMLAAALIDRKRLGPRAWLGAALSTLGVGLIVAESLRLSSAPAGYLFMGGAALSWVAYTFVTRPLFARYSRLQITFWQSLAGTIGFLPFLLLERTDWASVSPAVWGHVLYLGVACSALGYWFYVVALERLGPGASSVFINLIPVVSVVASFLLLGERLGPWQLSGGAVAVAGVWLATSKDAG
ncbi:MAG: DMT family transporter [Spirochaetales bacterium]|nr:DMT family transporter [Spirochaetales bacterium]